MKFYTYEEILKILKKKKIYKIFTFGQSRGGTTFSSYTLAKELRMLNYFVPEKISNFLNIKRMFVELIKNEKIFIHCHHHVLKRHMLNNKKTIFIYIYRNDKDILKSMKLAEKRNSKNHFDFNKDIQNRVMKKLKIKKTNGPKFLNNLWKDQIKTFHMAYTLKYDSFKNHPDFIKKNIRKKNFKNLKQISLDKKNKIKDNFKLRKYHKESGLKYIKLILIYFYYKIYSIIS